MKRSEAERLAAIKRAEDMEANMAIEGLSIHPDDRAVLNKIMKLDVPEDEADRMLIEHFKAQGIIPADYEDESASLVAE